MSLVLGIDTSTVVSIGLWDGENVRTHENGDSRHHVEDLMPMIVDMLADAGYTLADVTAIGVGVGPGPFTGLRVGMVTAQTLATVLDVPLKNVCSLDVVALTEGDGEEFLAAIDARRKEWYWARYVGGERVEGPAVGAPDSLPSLPVFGGPDAHVDAGLLARHLDQLPDAGPEPLYLRRPDATEPGQRKSALTSLVGRRRKDA